jgi:hypothetical protein
MTEKRGSQRAPSAQYIAKAKALSSGEIELLRQRMQERFARRRTDSRFSMTEVLALQLEYEDKQLDQWRICLTKIRQAAQSGPRAEGISFQQSA